MLKSFSSKLLHDKMRILQNVAIVVGYSLVAFTLLRKLLFMHGTIGYALDWIFPPYPSQYVQMASNELFSINSYSGGNINYLVPALFLDQALGFLGYIGLNGEIISKSFCLFVLVLTGSSLYYLCRTINVGYLASFVAGLFYIANPIIFNKFWQGHITYLLSYALAPLVLLLFFRCTKTPKNWLKTSLLTGLVFGLTWTQGQFAVMVFVLIMFYCLFASNFKELRLRIKSLSVVSSVAILMNFHWLLIALTTTPAVFSHVTAIETATNLSPKLIDVFRLGTETYVFQFDNVFLSFLLPLIAFSAILLKPKDKMVLYFSLVAVISLFFCSGTNPPFGSFYAWFSLYVPASSLFRDVYHLAFIPALACSTLVAEVVDKLIGKGSEADISLFEFRFATMRNLKKTLPKVVARFAVPLILVIILLSSSSSIFTGDFKGTVRVYDLGDDYKQTYDYLENLAGDFRIAWLPMTAVGNSQTSPLIWTGRNPMITLPPKPSLDADYQVWQKYPAFLAQTISSNRTKSFGELLGLANVKYVVTATDFLGHYTTPWNQTQLLDGQPNLVPVRTFGNVTIFQNNNFLPKIYSADDVALIAGDLSALTSLSYYMKFMNKNLPSTFFASQQAPANRDLFDLVDTIIIQDNDFQDLAFSLIDSSYRLNAGAYARHNYPLYGWTYGGYEWPVDWDFTTQLNDLAISGTNDTLLIPFEVPETTDYEVWARVYFGEDSLWGIRGLNASITFSMDGNDLGSVITGISAASWNQGFRWVKFGPTEFGAGKHDLEILGRNGVNVIGQIVIAPSGVLTDVFNTACEFMQNKHIIILSNIEKTAETNDLMIPSTQWNIDASEGVALRSIAPTQLSDSLFVPTAGDYEIFLRTTHPGFINQQATESTHQIIDDFESLGEWQTFGEGNISLSSQYVKSGNYSLQYSVDINKTASPESIHLLYEEIPPPYGNWSRYDTLGFWIYPKTFASEPDTYIVLAARNSKNEWYATYQYVPNNQWSYRQVDISSWMNRSDINLLRLVMMGDQWGTSYNGQHIDFCIDALRLDKKVFSDFEWFNMGNVSLTKGYNNVSFYVGSSGVGVDLLVLEHKGKAINTESTSTNISYTNVNPTEYLVHVNTSKPFFLVFGENFHPFWQASIDGNVLEHFEVNAFVNAYYVDKLGDFTIAINFALEKLHEVGMATTLLSIVSCISILLIPERCICRAKNRAIDQLRRTLPSVTRRLT
jgi:hypothetical protein